MKYDIVSIGSAVYDIFLESSEIVVLERDEFTTGKGICVNLGSKADINALHHRTGGSALNTSITFARQGLKSAIFAKIGDDEGGHFITTRMRGEGVSDEFLQVAKTGSTSTGILVHSPEGERSIFIWRGVSTDMNIEPKQIDNILKSTEWIYITHIPLQSKDFFEYVMNNVKRFGVKVAMNPGSTQLKDPKVFIPVLAHVDILFVNQEEASHLTGIDYNNPKHIFERLDRIVKGIVVMTKGKNGVTVSDGKTQYRAQALEDPSSGFVDRTGAGDAFGSGFTTAIIKNRSIEEAIQLGSANATGVIAAWGANQGLLGPKDKPSKYGEVNIDEKVFLNKNI